MASATCLQLTASEISYAQQTLGYAAYQQLQATVLFQDASMSIDPGLAVGSVIATGTSSALPTATAVMTCTNGGTTTLSLAGATPSSLSGVYNTNVPGIGFTLSYVRANGTLLTFPASQSIQSGTGGPTQVVYETLGAGSRFQIQLIKTGDIASNVNVQFGTVGTETTDGDGKAVVLVGANGLNIKVLPSCSVDSSKLNIDFGTFGPTDVSTTSGPTQPINFNVLCTGPTPPASITAALSGTPDTNAPSMLKNTGASNLAIQLKEVSTGTILQPNNPNSTLVHTPSGGMQSPFALQATVLRVVSTTPTAGKIQATATITMTIL
ncbi:fimbrial protein [Paraburkholderia sp. J12]|uniref:fimbrial protein n=1 Tax=Paraburkholderia sp. J12 TaxID=2805432 RepID=UPI002ABDBA89|nr:fimbrial protein [Paraburkholderia sp. J12]